MQCLPVKGLREDTRSNSPLEATFSTEDRNGETKAKQTFLQEKCCSLAIYNFNSMNHNQLNKISSSLFGRTIYCRLFSDLEDLVSFCGDLCLTVCYLLHCKFFKGRDNILFTHISFAALST